MLKILSKGRCLWDFYVSGKVIVFSDDEFPSLEECRGRIIVTHIPSPDIVLYMREALAVVAETGGLLCHAAVLALELGCPIIVAAEGIKNKVKDGDEIVLEGKDKQGIIYEKTV